VAQHESSRAIWYALGANLAVMAAKAAGGLYTGSGALLAESLHSLADSGNQALLLWGRHRAKAPPSPDHPLGHGREVYFWSFVVALLLFSIGGLVSIYEGLHKLTGHEGLRSPLIALSIIAFALVAEGVSMRTALARANQLRHGRSLWRWFRETRRSDLLVVLSEDSAALVGLGCALAAVVATMVSGNPTYDAVGSIAIGGLLVIVALTLAAEIKSLLVGESAAPEVRQRIREVLQGSSEVHAVESLVTLQYGPDVVVLTRLAMRPASLATSAQAIEGCKRALREAVSEVSLVFVELDLTEDAEKAAVRDRATPPIRRSGAP
jgi:cation diffusion facilitator family transporter